MTDPLQDAVRAVLEQLGPEIVADAAQICSKPWPPASAPGEAPHLRTGQLAGGFGYEVVDGSDGPTLNLMNTAPYADTVNASRPFVDLITAKWGPVIAERIAAALGK